MRSKLIEGFAAAAIVAGLAAPAHASVTLDIEQRVAARKAIEQVYWSHRLWPRENPGVKPALDEILTDAQVRARVEDELRESAALAALWSRPVTTVQVQAELDRMVGETHDGARLREMFQALGDDPQLIAETLARPALVRRLIRDWYAYDPRFHGELKARAEAALATCGTASCMPKLDGEYHETIWRRGDIEAEAWPPLLARLARSVGGTPERLSKLRSSAVEETKEAFTVTAVLAQSDGEVRVATTSWVKRPFDAWWSEARRGFSPDPTPMAGALTLNSPQLTACADDTWSAIPGEIPEPRMGHQAVWTGSEMIVWGGTGAIDQATGARYDPATDTWTITSTAGAPAARGRFSAVWTGTQMIVWGGLGGGTALATGGRYDPSADAWSPTSVGTNLPAARSGHTAVWTGTQLIVWGGNSAGAPLNSGGRYDPATDGWTPTSTGTNVPAARDSHTAVWTGTQMIVWGGQGSTGSLNTGGRYTPGTDAWTATSVGANVPVARIQHSAVWTGSVMIIWGGQPSPQNTGGRYNPTTNAWAATSTGANVPAGRYAHTAVWTGTEMIVWGGVTATPTTTYLNSGGRYNPTANTWLATSTGANVPAGRYTHTVVWTGTEMIVWGGATPSLSYTGGRYAPATDSWVRTSTGSSVPTARYQHSGVWTGAEMIVWGGRGDGPALDTGAAYDPATASWSPITQSGAPVARAFHTTVWTGTKMIVWGGGSSDLTVLTNTGGAYDPAAGTWSPTSVGPGVPDARDFNTAIWTGTEMIVWGGRTLSADVNTGARYAPATDTWTPTSTGPNVPSARNGHVAAWTGSAMVVWGSELFTNTGGRYFPATDSWLPTSTGANVPQIGSSQSSAVWTGSQVIIWGGNAAQTVNTGALYDPVADAWASTSTGANCPSPRYAHNALWTGREMIVWGGGNDKTGGRYNPATNTWTATSTGAGCPERRLYNSAVWTGSEMIVWGGTPTTATGGRYCACGFAAPSGVPVLAINRPAPGTARLTFTYAGGDAPAFDVVRGDLSTLRSSAGDYATSTTGCLGSGVTGPVDDPGTPAAGNGYWYLIRPRNCGGRGTYDTTAASQLGTRDVEIAASGHDCAP